MQRLELIKRRLDRAQDLQSVVRTMKTLAAVNIRQYERAGEALAEYNRTTALGLQILFANRFDGAALEKRRAGALVGAIVFGSDQGMCGQFNEQITVYARNVLSALSIVPAQRLVLAVGERAAARLEETNAHRLDVLHVPSSVTGIAPLVQDLLIQVERWQTEQAVGHVLVFYNQPLSGASYRAQHIRLLPIELAHLPATGETQRHSRTLPLYTMNAQQLLSALIRQHLFVVLFRAAAESLASENASRLTAMQAAERNIQEWIAALTARYHRERQESITGELLDIVSGFQVLEDVQTV